MNRLQQLIQAAQGNKRGARAPRKASKLIDGLNSLERSYRDHLERQKALGVVIWYKVHPGSFSLLDNKRETLFYRPDFMVQFADGDLEIHETKGRMEEDAWIKLKLFDDQYPFRVRVIKRDKAQPSGFSVETMGE